MAETASARQPSRPPAVARVLERIAGSVRAGRMFEPGSCVVAAVSGGPDSLCLLHSLVRLRGLLRISVACFHFDHGLRAGSSADVGYVRRQADRLGVPFFVRAAFDGPPKGESVEAWARTARYQALLEVLEESGSAAAALGHTLDDQAETVLMAMLRGGGLEALAGMRPVSRPFVRPLLEVTRTETEAFCRALHLRPRRDPMNEDPSFLRVAVRRGIPQLETSVGRSVRGTLARTAGLLARDADFLDGLADQATREVVLADGSGRRLRSGLLAELPEAVASRVVRRQVLSMGVLPEAAHVEAVLDLARGRPRRAVSLPDGLRAERDSEYVRLVRPSPRRRR